jgi:hypothetical protein
MTLFDHFGVMAPISFDEMEAAMRRLIVGFAMLVLVASNARAQSAMEKAGTMAGHCQQPVKKQDGSQVKNAEGHIVTMDCPNQGTGSHPALKPQDRRLP